jgi:putative oxidoreductase
MWVEIAAGIALILGVYSRWVAVALILVLAGSIVLVHGSSGWLFSNEGGGWEYPLFLIAASVAQFFLGDGAYALIRNKEAAGQLQAAA